MHHGEMGSGQNSTELEEKVQGEILGEWKTLGAQEGQNQPGEHDMGWARWWG